MNTIIVSIVGFLFFICCSYGFEAYKGVPIKCYNCGPGVLGCASADSLTEKMLTTCHQGKCQVSTHGEEIYRMCPGDNVTEGCTTNEGLVHCNSLCDTNYCNGQVIVNLSLLLTFLAALVLTVTLP